MRALSAAQLERLREEVPGQEPLWHVESAWAPPLPRIRCHNCGDESLGPWVPIQGYLGTYYLCGDCWGED